MGTGSHRGGRGPARAIGSGAATGQAARLVLAGLAAQIVGVSVQAVFHLVDAPVAPLLT